MCVTGAEGTYGVSGRSLRILRGGHTNVYVLATLNASNHNSPERRKGMRRDRCGTVEREDVRERYGTRRGKPGVAQAGWLLGVEGGRRGGRGGGVAWRRVAGEERENISLNRLYT